MEASSVALPSRALQLSEDELTPSKKRERAYAMLRCVCKHLRIECTDGVARLFHLFKYVGRIAMRQYRLAKYHDTYRYYDHWWKWYYASPILRPFPDDSDADATSLSSFTGDGCCSASDICSTNDLYSDHGVSDHACFMRGWFMYDVTSMECWRSQFEEE